MDKNELRTNVCAAENEFEWLCKKLGYGEHSIQAFIMTKEYAKRMKVMNELWEGGR